MGSVDLREKAIGLANEAVAADNAGDFDLALSKYVQAIETFQVALKYEKAPSVVETIRAKVFEYLQRAEYLKGARAGAGAGTPRAARGGSGLGKGATDDSDDNDDEADDERPPLTEEELIEAERAMEEDLSKLVGMETVKQQMRKLCKQLALDIVRRNEGQTVLAPIRHCLMTGNPGTGKTSIARLVARLYKRLGVSSKDHVVEVQKGDLVAGYVNQTGAKTAKKIREARGGVLFVDEAYQLTASLMRGQSDFSGEAIDEMMKVMNDSGPRSVTFIFAGYRKEMDQFMSYNPGLESRVKYRFHFDDYGVADLVKILQIKLNSAGWKLDKDAAAGALDVIEKGTTEKLRSRYNGRLVDNLFQWASDELNARVTVGSRGADLVTLTLPDLQRAVSRFAANRPTDRITDAANASEAGRQLLLWGLGDYCEAVQEAGYATTLDLQQLDEHALRSLKMLAKPADARRARALLLSVKADALGASMARDQLYAPPDCRNLEAWLESVGCAACAPLLREQGVGFDVLGALTYDDLKEMGVQPIGVRRRLARSIELFAARREASKATAELGALEVGTAPPATGAAIPPAPPVGAGGAGGAPPGAPTDVEKRLSNIIGSVLPTVGRRSLS